MKLIRDAAAMSGGFIPAQNLTLGGLKLRKGAKVVILLEEEACFGRGIPIYLLPCFDLKHEVEMRRFEERCGSIKAYKCASPLPIGPILEGGQFDLSSFWEKTEDGNERDTLGALMRRVLEHALAYQAIVEASLLPSGNVEFSISISGHNTPCLIPKRIAKQFFAKV